MNTYMKAKALVIILIIFIVKTVFANEFNTSILSQTDLTEGEKLKKEALQILELKCNVCHKKQNPFMVFKEKNMEKRAPKINQVVFIERRMPKGDEIKLSKKEYTQLKNWLASLNIY